MKDLNAAFKQAITSYWEGKEPVKMKKEMKGRFKYDKKSFHELEEKMLGSKTEIDTWEPGV